MSSSEIARLRDDARTSEELRAALIGAGTDVDKIVAVAAEHGYSFTKQELEEALGSLGGHGKLSEEDLSTVSGGLVGDFIKGWVT